ncbi:MAG: AAA family ATPase [Candidatus Omnitrophota bacterium]
MAIVPRGTKGNPSVTRIIAIVNQKGGVGKTTTAVNLAACLAHNGMETILIDLDPQGNATSGVGINKRGVESSIFDPLIENIPLSSILRPTSMTSLRIAPSNNDLLSVEMHLASEENGNRRLRTALAQFLWSINAEKRVDYVIIDCPPSFGMLSMNAILAADSVLIPVQCEYYALEGLTEILTSTTVIREQYNKSLSLAGILLTMSDRRLNLSRQVEEDIRQAYCNYVFETVINRSVRLSEAPSYGMPIILYDPSSTGADSYISLALEVIENETKSLRPWPLRSSG